MTREDIVRMAREAGFEINKGRYHGMDADSYLYIWCDGGYQDEELERFATLVADHEREKFTIHAAALVRNARQDAIERERDRRAFELAECYRCGWDSGANAERVECARACIEVGATKANSDDGLDIADLCAAAIRARGAQ